MEFVHYSYGYIFKKTQKPFKCNNCANVKNSLCRKQWTIFMRKQWTVLLNEKKKIMNVVSGFEYTVNMMGRVQILLM